ncbi:DUF4177 domain-containing protein [Anabaena sp. PCC 7108]|uniref:DUF4177 domain-containing protein n=1 Tax=Anabaena sp. PCC 7108 TaxID=163908 RepID=UPI0003470D70|nr:DUF4177 domain-containing protein [Anabaena sp. PCC 7108]
MYKQYSVSIVVTEEIQKECNSYAGEGWQLVTAYMTARVDCCNNRKESAVLIFGK